MAYIPKVNVRRRGNSYFLDYRTPDNRRHRATVGTSKQIADATALQFNQWLMVGKNPEQELARMKRAAEAQATTLRQFYPIFMERHGQYQSTSMQRRYGTFYKNLCRCSGLADMPIGQLTRATGEDYLILRRQDTFNGKTITVATVNREGAWLKGMLERAVDWEYLSENPFRKLTKFKEMNKRDVDLSLEQVEELAAALPHPMNLVVIFAACRGLRAEEIFSLRIENVTFFDMVPDSHTPVGKIVQKVKGGIAKTFVLDAQSTSVLQQAIGDRTEGYVFINARTRTRYAGVSQSFRKAVNRLGLTALQNGKRVPLTFHDLRHCFVTWLLNQGVPIDIAQHLVGHQSSQMTERYASRDSMALGRALSLLPKLTKVG